MCLKPGLPVIRRKFSPCLFATGDSTVLPSGTKKNSERRKEKSRDAARCRRGKESEIFGDLGSLLPLETPLSATLDKASVIRIAIAYLRTRSLVHWGLEVPSSEVVNLGSNPLRDLFPERGKGPPTEGILGALDGFLIVLTKEGDVIFTSENISSFLGLSQLDVMGHSLLDYTHPCDHDEVRHLATLVRSGPCTTFLRFKCTLTPKGRSVNLKSATYKVVQVTGQVLNAKGGPSPQNDPRAAVECLPHRSNGSWIVALAVPVPHPSNIEVPLDKQTFVSKHSLDMRFTYVDENVWHFCGYRPSDLLGRSLYQVNHALDTLLIKEAYKTLRSKGQVETGRYRFLSHGGGYVWVVTQATLITGNRDSKPQYVVCLNYVISEIESGDIIFSECQLEAAASKRAETSCPLPVAELAHSADISHSPISSVTPPATPIPPLVTPIPPLVTPPRSVTAGTLFEPPVTSPGKPSPVTATCSLLRDRTEDMNEGYLTFSDYDSHLTVLKEDPDDLTHLAPSVGDDCVPLEVPVFYPGFDDLLEVSPTGFGCPKSQIGGSVEDSTSVFSVPKTPRSGTPNQGPRGTIGNSVESFLNDPVIPGQKEFPFALGEGALPPLIGGPHSQHKQKRRQLEQLPLLRKLRYSNSQGHKVPEQGVRSPQSGVSSPNNRFDTPEPPVSPLLSQTASPFASTERGRSYNPNFGGACPTPATSRLFTNIDDEGTEAGGPTMDILGMDTIDLKLEDDLELRAPYIPPIDEVLVFEDDLFGFQSSCDNQESRNDDMNPGARLRIIDPLSLPGPNGSPNVGSISPQHSFHQSKLGTDTGGGFVDPNQVLPGQFYIKGEDKGIRSQSFEELRSLLEAPQSPLVRDTDDPEPYIRGMGNSTSYVVKGTVKRSPSPLLLAPSKKLRPWFDVTSSPTNQRRPTDADTPPPTSQRRDLPTPYAPLMQQLLVSKEPICLRGRVVSSPSPNEGDCGRAKGPSSSAKANGYPSTHSVLRNLLVSGRDDRAGYAVFVSRLADENGKVEGNKSNEENSLSPESALYPLNNFPLNKEGKVELTKQQLALLLNRAGVLHSNSFTGAASPSNMSPPGCSTPQSSVGPGQAPTLSNQSMKDRQTLLMMNSNLSAIPTLLDLTSFDCEVNAPAPDPSILQGSELLMALEQNQ